MLLEVDNLSKSYFLSKGIFSKKEQKVLNDISFFIKKGECLGIIGESGSGKSTLGRIILGLEKPCMGNIHFHDDKKMSVVFQDYSSSVNPRFKVLQIISEPLLKLKLSKKQRKNEVIALLEKVGLDESFINRYAHELSGGQLQRVCIARAISTKPKFILLDEAVSSLDISIQVQVLDLLIKLKKEENLSYLFITHDLLTVSYICDRVIFFKEGRIVEQVDCISKLKDINHEYSKSLLRVYKR